MPESKIMQAPALPGTTSDDGNGQTQAQFRREQVSRLGSALVLGPYMVYTSRTVREPWFRRGLAVIGLATIGYNAYLYLRDFDRAGAFGLGDLRGLQQSETTRSWASIAPVDVLNDPSLLEQAARYFEQYAPPDFIESFKQPALEGDHGPTMQKLAEHGIYMNPGYLDRWGAPPAKIKTEKPKKDEPTRHVPIQEPDWSQRVEEFKSELGDRASEFDDAPSLAEWCNQEITRLANEGMPQRYVDELVSACQTRVDALQQPEPEPEPEPTNGDAAADQAAAQLADELDAALSSELSASELAERCNTLLNSYGDQGVADSALEDARASCQAEVTARYADEQQAREDEMSGQFADELEALRAEMAAELEQMAAEGATADELAEQQAALADELRARERELQAELDAARAQMQRASPSPRPTPRRRAPAPAESADVRTAGVGLPGGWALPAALAAGAAVLLSRQS